jgi:hypothetical protein
VEFDVIHHLSAVNVCEIEALHLLECLDVLESQIDELVKLASVEPIQILLFNQLTFENTVFVISAHFVNEEIEEEFLGRLLPVITDLDEEEGVDLSDKYAIRLAFFVFAEYLDGELLVILEFAFG